MSDKQDIYDLDAKIDWEGGIDSALDYGVKIHEYDVSSELEAAWYEMEDAYEAFSDIRATVYALIEEEKRNA
jgi:hypothetical protein